MTKAYERDFQALQTTQKGNAGERIVERYLKRHGWIVFAPVNDAPHPVDFICYKPGQPLRAADVKTYPRRANYCDTGIDAADFTGYLSWEQAHGIGITLFFVDAFEGLVYGNALHAIAESARHEGSKVYFPLPALRPYHWLNRAELAALRASGRQPAGTGRYSTTEQYFTRDGFNIPGSVSSTTNALHYSAPCSTAKETITFNNMQQYSGASETRTTHRAGFKSFCFYATSPVPRHSKQSPPI